MNLARISVWCFLAGLLALAGFRAGAAEPAAPGIDFGRQIRPILSENCFACHGPDEKKRQHDLRLDTKAGALGRLREGGYAIVPGKPLESELVSRITETDAAKRMPPAASHKTLTPAQIELITQWIGQGARWSEHWAFVTPSRPPIPKVMNASWGREPLDAFILHKLEASNLRPAKEADRVTWIRRVTLDLTGLPPTLAEVDAFVADKATDAYEKVVDRLLRSPRFGEHMARYWLDDARFGDTHGLHLDNYREMWPYRDWVINAFNRNLPYDQFIVEQLAGDLLPNATLEQIVASGFNRCHVTTSEGGSIAEEVYVRNVVDRIDTTGTVFMGLSIGCARCHDHKFDPIASKDYYRLFAFFNNLDSNPLDGNAARYAPIARVPTAEQAAELAKTQERLAQVQKKIAAELAKVKYDEAADPKLPEKTDKFEFVWVEDALPSGAREVADGSINGKWEFVSAPAPVFSGAKSIKRSSDGLGQVVFQDANPGLRVGAGDVLFAYVRIDPAKPPQEIMLQWHSDTWRHRAYWGDNKIDWGKDNSGERFKVGQLPDAGKWVRLEVDAAKVGIKPGTIVTGFALTQFGGTVYWDKAGIVTRTPQGAQAFDTVSAWLQMQKATGGAGLPKPLQDILKIETAKRTADQQKQLRDYFLEHAWSKTRAVFDPLHQQQRALEQERDKLDAAIPATLVSKENDTPKPAFMLKRGEYDKRGEQVDRQTPAFLPPMSADLPKNRLGFAKWLVDRNHPLTARVAANRFWQQLFGTGLVKTEEDFGSQGEPPSHPELLDWLAMQFMDDGWNVKKFMRMIVLSATYRQSSRGAEFGVRASESTDPNNRLLWHGPRYRLDAEMLRDQALFASGLLVEKVGGPSVKPPQPAGLWEAVGYVTSNTRNFSADTGHEKVHRRSLYTFWKRTAPPPQMSTFDAPSREACMARRERTNTPLQALLMMNETQYVECARALAERTMREAGTDAEARIMHMFRLATCRKPDAGEMTELLAMLHDYSAIYTKNPEAAKKLIAIGETKPDAKLAPAELAAWTMEANLILNLDEVLNKE
ncbi:MAG TPA: PSD1 and planctomycete cytochrome C domain-containing protein [Gemmataceae bacterium]|nr:PSD1 and planctomycete cytochrome C domain-containing protein [Gemmataceae bacterium]